MQEQPLNYTFNAENNSDKRQNFIEKYIWVIYLLLVIYALVNLAIGKFTNVFLAVIPAAALASSLYNKYKRKNRPKTYVTLSADSIHWFLESNPNLEVVEWKNIHWIEWEKNLVRFYTSSSFSQCLPYVSFAEKDLLQLKEIITNEASARNIKMVKHQVTFSFLPSYPYIPHFPI